MKTIYQIADEAERAGCDFLHPRTLLNYDLRLSDFEVFKKNGQLFVQAKAANGLVISGVVNPDTSHVVQIQPYKSKHSEADYSSKKQFLNLDFLSQKNKAQIFEIVLGLLCWLLTLVIPFQVYFGYRTARVMDLFLFIISFGMAIVMTIYILFVSDDN